VKIPKAQWKQPAHPAIVVRSNMGGSASSNTSV
jgi:hypothetical protein